MAGAQQILREYLVSLGFKTDTRGQKNFTSTLTDVGKAADFTGLKVAGAAAAVAGYIAAYTNNMEKLYWASRRTGEAAGNLRALTTAGERFGIAGDRMQGVIDGVASSLRNNPAMASILKGTFGVTAKAGNPVQTVFDTVRKLRDQYGLPGSPLYNQGAQFAQKTLGINEPDYQKLVQELDALEETYHRTQRAQSDFGVDVDKLAKTSVDAKNAFRELFSEFNDFVVGGVLTKFAPEIDAFTQDLHTNMVRLNADIRDSHSVMQFLDKRKGYVGNFLKDQFLPDDAQQGAASNVWKALRYALVSAGQPAGYAEGRGVMPVTEGSAGHMLTFGGGGMGDQGTPTPGAGTPSDHGNIKRHNPGNIKDTSGAFRTFGSDEEGLGEMGDLLARRYFGKGLDTVRSIIETYAPRASKGGDNPDYITDSYEKTLSKRLGVGMDAKLDRGNLTQMSQLMQFMVNQELGRQPFSASEYATAAKRHLFTGPITVTVSGAGNPNAVAAAVVTKLSTINGNTAGDHNASATVR